MMNFASCLRRADLSTPGSAEGILSCLQTPVKESSECNAEAVSRGDLARTKCGKLSCPFSTDPSGSFYADLPGSLLQRRYHGGIHHVVAVIGIHRAHQSHSHSCHSFFAKMNCTCQVRNSPRHGTRAGLNGRKRVDSCAILRPASENSRRARRIVSG
jgi:hypothetical protein